MTPVNIYTPESIFGNVLIQREELYTKAMTSSGQKNQDLMDIIDDYCDCPIFEDGHSESRQ